MSYRRMKLAVGLFVITFTLLFALLIYVVLEKKGVFEEKLLFDFYTQSAESFYIGMPLRFSGFEVGAISDIALTEEGRVHVTFEIKQSNRKWICEDTLLMLDKPLIGSPTIDVLSSLAYPTLAAGSTLNIIVRDDINDIITNVEPVVNDLQSIVTSVNTLTARISADDSDLFATINNLKRFSANLAGNKALLTTITGDEKSTEQFKTALGDTAATVKEVNALVRKMEAITRSLDEKIITPASNTIEQVNPILHDVKRKLDMLEGTVSAIGSYDTDLLELKDDIRYGIEKTNGLIEKIDAIIEGQHSPEIKLP